LSALPFTLLSDGHCFVCPSIYPLSDGHCIFCPSIYH
jgi:diadenosine tetraphosphate (Ap4A) HIT family hydrolase